MRPYFSHVVVHEVPDSMMGDATQTRPLTERPDRRFFSDREDAAATEGLNVHKGRGGKRGRLEGVHALTGASTRATECSRGSAEKHRFLITQARHPVGSPGNGPRSGFASDFWHD